MNKIRVIADVPGPLVPAWRQHLRDFGQSFGVPVLYTNIRTKGMSNTLNLTEIEIAQLSPYHVQLLRMRDEGRSYAEMAAETNRPKGTIRSGLHRARARLAELRGTTKLEPELTSLPQE